MISIKLLYNFSKIILWHGCSPINLLQIFRTSFPENPTAGLLLKQDCYVVIQWNSKQEDCYADITSHWKFKIFQKGIRKYVILTVKICLLLAHKTHHVVTEISFLYSALLKVARESKVWKNLENMTDAHSEPCQTSEMEYFTKIDINYFCKTLYLRCLLGFWKYLCMTFSSLSSSTGVLKNTCSENVWKF